MVPTDFLKPISFVIFALLSLISEKQLYSEEVFTFFETFEYITFTSLMIFMISFSAQMTFNSNVVVVNEFRVTLIGIYDVEAGRSR